VLQTCSARGARGASACVCDQRALHPLFGRCTALCSIATRASACVSQCQSWVIWRLPWRPFTISTDSGESSRPFRFTNRLLCIATMLCHVARRVVASCRVDDCRAAM
jgi:hypothetical protein